MSTVSEKKVFNFKKLYNKITMRTSLERWKGNPIKNIIKDCIRDNIKKYKNETE